MTEAPSEEPPPAGVPLATVAREWTRIGVIGFGGPPAHIVLLRRLMVDRRHWMDAREFEDANAACGLLPGPGSTQLAIFCAYRVGGPLGAIIGGLGFVLPAVVFVLLLSVVFFGHAPPLWIRGAGAGAGAAVAAVAVHAAFSLLVPSYQRVRATRARLARWSAYLAAAGRGRSADRALPRAGADRLRADRARAAAPAAGQPGDALGPARGAGAAGRRSRRPGRALPGPRSRSARSPTAAAS